MFSLVLWGFESDAQKFVVFPSCINSCARSIRMILNVVAFQQCDTCISAQVFLSERCNKVQTPIVMELQKVPTLKSHIICEFDYLELHHALCSLS